MNKKSKSKVGTGLIFVAAILGFGALGFIRGYDKVSEEVIKDWITSELNLIDEVGYHVSDSVLKVFQKMDPENAEVLSHYYDMNEGKMDDDYYYEDDLIHNMIAILESGNPLKVRR